MDYHPHLGNTQKMSAFQRGATWWCFSKLGIQPKRQTMGMLRMFEFASLVQDEEPRISTACLIHKHVRWCTW